MGSIAVMVVATQNFHTIDWLIRASDNSVFRSDAHELGDARLRDLLRYLSSELNRLYFREWNFAQLALGAAIVPLVARRRDARRLHIFVGAMLTVVIVMALWMTPEITAIGRRLDFVPRTPPPAELGRFWILHAIYTSLEIVKVAIAFVVAAALARDSERSVQET